MKYLTFLAAGTCFAASAFAENYTAINDGNWTDPEVWGGTVPTEADSVTIGENVIVDITSAVTIDKIQYAHNYNSAGTINIAGEDASLTLSSSSDLYYNYMMLINVEEGAKLAGVFNWGSGGYYKINIDASTFEGGFAQLQGSSIDMDAGVYLTNGAVANATTSWNLNPTASGNVSSLGHAVTVSIDSSTLNMTKSDTFIQGNAAGSDTAINLLISNGSTANNLGSFSASGANSTANITIADSSATAVGSTLSALGESSTLNYTVQNSKYSMNGDFKMLADSNVKDEDENIIESNSTLNVSFIDNEDPISISHMYIGARNGGYANFTMRNSEINTGFFYIGQHEYNLGSNVYNNGFINLSLYNSKMTFTQFKVNYWDNSTITIALSGNSKMIQSGSNTVNFGTRDGMKDGGDVILQFGDYVDGTFVAAQAGAFQGSYEFFATSTSTIKFLLGAENFTKIGEQTMEAILSARFFKPVQGEIVLDFSNVAGLSAGYYTVALIACTSGQSLDNINGLTASYNDLFEQNVIETDIVKLFYDENGDCFTIKDGVLYANVEVLNIIPEPSACAAIFGALALAFAAYSRRK